MKYTKNLLLISIMLVIASVALAQRNDSLEVHQLNGKFYYIHLVAKGESLYAISKKYEVPIDVIKKENPSVLDGLSIDEKIFIPLKKEVATESTFNGNILKHKVLPQQTLYTISKIYNVTQNEILAVNADLSDNLQEGQLINIPIKNIKSDKKIEDSWQRHQIKKGETLYSISKKYAVTIDALKSLNNGLAQGLKEGDKILIPIKQDNERIEKPIQQQNLISNELINVLEQAFDTTKSKKSIYKIGLLLPFYVYQNEEITETKETLEKDRIYPKSRFAVEFYNGFLFALNAISSVNQKFELYVYDTNGQDSTKLASILAKPEMKLLDLIVGPLYQSNFETAAKFANTNKIPIVSPVRQLNKVLLGNEMVYKVIPSQTGMIDKLATLLVDSFKTQNIIALKNNASQEKMLIEPLIKAYKDKVLLSADTLMYASIKTVEIERNFSEIVNKFSSTKTNVIFLPSINQAYITDFFNFLVTKLNGRDYKDYKVTLIGLEEWLTYENIELTSFELLNVYLPVHSYSSENDTSTLHVINDYVASAKTYPSKTTLLGYDIANYFGNILLKYGKINSTTVLSSSKKKGTSIHFNFHKTGVESGCENESCYILNFKNYELVKVY